MQKISTPSVIDIKDSKILSSAAHGSLPVVGGDPWDTVLSVLDLHALDPATVVAGMDNAATPDASNPFVTQSLLTLRLENRGFVLIGPVGSNADFEGTTDVTFNSAIASLPPDGGTIMVMPNTYTFNSSCVLPEGVRVVGVHPLSVTIGGTGDFSVFELVGDRSRLDFLTLENPSAVSSPVVLQSGIDTTVIGCRIQNFALAGVAISGERSSVRYSKFDSDLGLGVLLQGYYQIVERCTFSGLLLDGAFHFESSKCSALSNFIDGGVAGKSYSIPAATCSNNKLAANHFGSAASVAASIDNGTATVRYANTPDTLKANENNFLFALKEYTGQPTLDSTVMTTSNQFATFGLVEAAEILSALDLFTQRTYEERNWFLTSDDPTFDGVGSPLTGVLSWDGTTLVWPNFKVLSMISEGLAPANEWPVVAGSSAIAAGEALVLTIDRDTPGATVPAIQTLAIPLVEPHNIVLAWSPVATVLVWTEGFRILSALTSFDINGMPLPIARFIGASTYYKNIGLLTPDFAPGDDVTEKLSSQTSHLKRMMEKTNLWKHSDDTIRTHPIVGEWLDLTDNLPESPSHLVQARGTTYGLFPNVGFYQCVRESITYNLSVWTPVAGFTLASPYASISLVGTSVAVLNTAGALAFWHPDQQTWTTGTPDISTLTMPLPSARPVSEAFGQSDFIFQTPEYSVFTLMDGSTLLYFQEANALYDSLPLGAETSQGKALIGRHLKDTGYNVARLGWIDTASNGACSTLEGLPLYENEASPIEIPPNVFSPSLESVQWDKLKQESFSHDPFSDARSRLHSVVTLGSGEFSDFMPHGWLVSSAHQEVVAFGTTISNNEFTVIVGSQDPDPVLPYVWTKTILGGVNSCVGSVGLIDQRNHDIHILASDLARSSRPTWWKFDRDAGSWSFDTFDDTGGGTQLLPQAVPNSFTYDATTDLMAGWGVAVDLGLESTHYKMTFLVRDAARGGRPTMYSYDGTTYAAIRLSEGPAPFDAVVVGADTTSVSQFYGGFYQIAWNAVVWATRSAANQIKIFTYFVSGNIWNVQSLGTGGTFLGSIPMGTPTFAARTGSLVSGSHLEVFGENTHSANLYLGTASGGLIKGARSAHYLTGYSGATWTRMDGRITLPAYSSNHKSTYTASLAPSRCDLSIQIGSLAEKTLPLFGAGVSGGEGLQWFEPGTHVKNVSDGLWLGLNRGGYLWIGNTTFTTNQQELTPNTSTVRGDIVVANLGYTDDFDWAFDGTYVGISYKDINNANKLGFILYNTTTNTIVHERGGASGVQVVYSTPRITYNTVTNSWVIVAESSTGRLLYFKRTSGGVWSEETSVSMLPGGSHPYMTVGSGKSPAKPMILSDGSLLVVTENGVGFNGLITRRDVGTGIWSTVYLSTGGGFKTPEITRTLDGLKWWVFGGDGGRVMASLSPTTGWAVLPSLSSVGYDRMSKPSIIPQQSSVLGATSAKTDGVAPADQEILVWRFDNTGDVRVVGAFTAMGRMQSALYSTEEETNFTNLSWVGEKLLYGATRPTRTLRHWSLRGSTNWENPQGESLLGSGRLLTLGERHFREQWSSSTQSGWGTSDGDLVFEYGVDASFVGTSSVFPLALRTDETDFMSLKWPYVASSGSLFTKGWDVSLVDDTDLATGTLITSATRRWPVILGSTRWGGIHQAGPAVFSQGGMMGLFPPTGMTNAAYFGIAAVGSSNLFKIRAKAAITFSGTHTWSTGPSNTYTLVGPVTFELDTSLAALGAHLVLDFNVASSLVLDPTDTPLSYWTDNAHNLVSYALVVGEVRAQKFILYPAKGSRANAVALMHGHLEPGEMGGAMNTWIYSLRKETGNMPAFEIIID
jgi:hypothetical protein